MERNFASLLQMDPEALTSICVTDDAALAAVAAIAAAPDGSVAGRYGDLRVIAMGCVAMALQARHLRLAPGDPEWANVKKEPIKAPRTGVGGIKR
jgi:uncharacterized protein (DUF2236 family)